jgi:hypothetical protein
MHLRDDQLAERLRNMATDALLSGDDHKHRILSLAAVRLMLMADKYQPKPEVTPGVTVGSWLVHPSLTDDDIWNPDTWQAE